jgi:hypothetical protein
MQYSCTQEETVIVDKRVQGLLVSCSFVLIALVFWILTYYMRTTSGLNAKKWDVNVVSASDFTVDYTITSNIWDDYV